MIDIDIELSQHQPSNGKHAVKIWINYNLCYSNEIFTEHDLWELHDELQSELRWLGDYLRKVAHG